MPDFEKFETISTAGSWCLHFGPGNYFQWAKARGQGRSSVPRMPELSCSCRRFMRSVQLHGKDLRNQGGASSLSSSDGRHEKGIAPAASKQKAPYEACEVRQLYCWIHSISHPYLQQQRRAWQCASRIPKLRFQVVKSSMFLVRGLGGNRLGISDSSGPTAKLLTVRTPVWNFPPAESRKPRRGHWNRARPRSAS